MFGHISLVIIYLLETLKILTGSFFATILLISDLSVTYIKTKPWPFVITTWYSLKFKHSNIILALLFEYFHKLAHLAWFFNTCF
jgi:hypothetical protein